MRNVLSTIKEIKVSPRNFNEVYEDLTAEELIEKYHELYLHDSGYVRALPAGDGQEQADK